MDSQRVNLRECDLSQLEEEFRSWDLTYCSELLTGLQRPYRSPPSLPMERSRSRAASRRVVPRNDGFHIQDLVSGSTANLSPNELPTPEKSFVPVPGYDMCTPVNRSDYVGDDLAPMPFRPFADDTAFPFDNYESEYRSKHEWESHNLDSDFEILAAELISRCHPNQEDITEPAVASLKQCAKTGIRIASQRRDLPRLPKGWTGWLASQPGHKWAGPRESLSAGARYFCNFPSCIVSYCTVHEELPPLQPSRPTISDAILANRALEACGEQCFLIRLSTRSITDAWTMNEVELLEVIVDHDPNALPCDLADICRKPCREVFEYRREYLATAKTRKQMAALRDTNSEKPIHSPCGHPGPCNEKSGCPCHANNVDCTLTCRCERKCPRQRRGCTCAKARPCSGRSCSCLRARMECDPRLCRGCCARYPSSDKACRNVALQQGQTKATEVRKGQYGLGLFLFEDVKNKDFIIEYSGELILEDTTKSRGLCADHTGRGYLFGLPNALSIDSSHYGNESRYINHSKREANCLAEESRIGIFAKKDLSKGTELLLDYGPHFFKTGGAARKVVGSSQSRKKASQASSSQSTEEPTFECIDDPLDPDYSDSRTGPSEASSSQ